MLYTLPENARNDPDNVTGLVYRVQGLSDGIVYVADRSLEYDDLIMRRGVFAEDAELWVTAM